MLRKAALPFIALSALLSHVDGQMSAPTDTDILNFALNLECLEVRHTTV